MKTLSKHHRHVQALMTSVFSVPVEYRDKFARLFPEYDESDRHAADFNSILMYFLAALLRGEGEAMNIALIDIQIQLGLAKNAVDARIKRLKKLGLIRTIAEPGAEDRRNRLAVPTEETQRRFVLLGLHMAAMQIQLGEYLKTQLAGFALPELEDGLYDPFADGISPRIAEQLAQYLAVEKEDK